MQEILTDLEAWQALDKAIAVATVVKTWGSSPRAPGAKMAVSQKGEMIGSVSGGCVEGAVVEEALGVLKTGQPKLLHFGVADETAWEVGLACGGTIEVFVDCLDKSIFPLLKECIVADQGVVLASVIRGPGELLGTKAIIPAEADPVGPLLQTLWRDQILQNAHHLLQQRPSSIIQHYDNPAIDIFFDVHRPTPLLIIIGGVHIAIDLIQFARPLGFRTCLVDPRTAFATPERFPHADQILNQWPDEALQEIELTGETSVVVVTHDPKLDDPALMIALPSPACYVGALGSPKTHAKRVKRLLAAGLTQEHLDRLRAPIGLDIGGRAPAEIALSIMAEIVADRNSKLVSKG